VYPEIIDDEERYGSQKLHALFASAVECRFGEFIEQCVRFAIEHAACKSFFG
jgi:hypothetical protein